MDQKKKYLFITYLRALAACLITNSHYEAIYPIKMIANGGLLGDVLFFAVSGYCLWRPEEKNSFFSWYAKRYFRCLVPVWIITAIYATIGQWNVSSHNFAYFFLYPTQYHFIASIIVLYVVFFFCMRFFSEKLWIPSGVLVCAYLFVYLLIFDKSYYHVDCVHEPMILFLFMGSMLLGAWFRKKQCTIMQSAMAWKIPVLFILVLSIAYIGSKLSFCRYLILSPYQLINQIILLLLLFCIFYLFCRMESKLPQKFWILRPVSWIAELTLEIYLVQGPIIRYFVTHTKFPVNWVLCTISILIAAWLLHHVCRLVMKGGSVLSDILIKALKV